MDKKKLDPRTRGVRNNNPFNIKRTSDVWKGSLSRSEQTDPSFVQFRSMYFGLRAGIVLLKNYIEMGYDTISDIIFRYAPPNENFTKNYISYCASFLENDYEPDDDLPFLSRDMIASMPIEFGSVQFYHLCYAICKYESEYDFKVKDYNNIMTCEFNPKYQL